MERKFYTDNFEKFLKGQADQFKMAPSKKVWHGIYNDLHPGKRWPSITMSIVFIFSLVVVVDLNTNNEHAKQFAQLTLFGKTISPLDKSAVNKKTKRNNSDKIITHNDAVTNPFQTLTTTQNNNINNPATISELNTGKKLNTVAITDKSIENTSPADENILHTSYLPEQQTNIASDNGDKINNDEKNLNNTIPYLNDDENLLLKKNIKSNILNQNIITAIKKNRKARGNVTYYLAPALSYRNFSNDQINGAVTQKPMPGFEAGTALNYKILKQLQFITGLQLNFSGYNIKTNNTHPILASLILNGIGGQPTGYNAVSQYGNRTGDEQTRLKNYSLQASIPIGLQYVFAENDNIQFSALATFQPSFVISNRAYLLSTDEKNYITDPDLLRSWNMSTNFGTFISFKSNSFKWQIGPQIRYQLLSTYTKNYGLKEHLVDYGIRFGISKISK